MPTEPDTEHRLPSCEDCHSSHTIARTDRSDFRFAMMDQCGNCHEQQAETFFETFHGKVSQLGSAGAAKCSDCHGTHGILPSSDPASTLGRDNIVATCGRCHEGSHRRFAGYLTHATHHEREKYPWLFWSFWGMTALLVGTLTFALLHTLAWLTRLYLSRDEWRTHKERAKAKSDTKLFRRFNHLQRGMHLAMLLSFFTLALTGMIIKFSYMGWAQGIAWALGGFETTGALHRFGAVVLFTVFSIHLWDVFKRKRRDRKTLLQVITGPDSIVFNKRDLTDVVQSIRWFFGLGQRPRYGRYTYWEKFDYFAVFWGVLVIGSTGLMLWLPELFTRILPGWSVNVATIIHSDEALLAVAFIFTIHFFNTHFRPDKFPIDPVIFTGRVTLDELKYDKPDEYARLVANGELEKHLVGPHPRLGERAARIFGFAALTVGLILIALIIYTMLFGYR
jgi:cytochrome b subunit of formate dehydrogenase